MSRSYKKHPIVQQAGDKRRHKRWANKRVRKAKDIPNGKGYRMLYNPWDLCDYWWRETWQEFFQKAHETDCYSVYDREQDMFGHVISPSWLFSRWENSKCEQPFEIWLVGEYIRRYIGK